MKELTKIRIIFLAAFSFIFIGIIIITLDSGLFYEEIDDIQSVRNIEQQERRKLHIPDNVAINFIFDAKMNRNIRGYVDIEKSSHNNYLIYLQKPVSSSTVRHELYHVYRFNKLYPLFWSFERQKRVGLLTVLNIVNKEQFLAYVYGWFGINLEL